MPQKITITLSDTGEANIEAPLTNKILCYGMLEIARDMVRNYKPAESSVLTLPPGARLPANEH